MIRLKSGQYPVPYGMSVSVRGTADNPVWICGPRSAVVSGASVNSNGGFKITDSSHLRLAGFTVRQSHKGISVLNSDHISIADMLVEHVGEEAIHLKSNTTDSVVADNTVRQTVWSPPSTARASTSGHLRRK